MAKFLYSAVVLDANSRLLLLREFGNLIPNDWEAICHHMTIGLKPLSQTLQADLGELKDLKVTHIGKSDMALAVKVEGYFSYNNIPHITLAINKKEGAKPMISNAITDWLPVEPIVVSGTVSEVYAKI
jgi:hypothetical protein